MSLFRLTSILFALAAAPGCQGKRQEAMTHRPYDIVELGRELNVTLPPNTRVIGVERENGMDDLVGAKVEIPDSDWPSFIASTPIKANSFRPGERGLLGEDHGFWDPNQAPGLRTAQATLPGVRALNIGVCTPSNGFVVLYIVNHGT